MDIYFNEDFYTESFESSDKTETSKVEHAYYKLKSGEWLCLHVTYKKVKKDGYEHWEKVKCESSVTMDKPGEPDKEEYLNRILEVVNAGKSKKGTY